MNTFAESFPPGEFLRDELEARGWTQTELAEIMGRPVRLINEIIAGKKAITPETAVQLGKSLGTSAEVWMNLESQYQLSKVGNVDSQIARRAELYERFPVREMIKRGWVLASKNSEVLEQQFKEFFGLARIEDDICFSHAAKKSDVESQATPLQNAWLFRARRIASEMVVSPYSEATLRKALPTLAALLSAAEEVRHVPRVLSEAGVRFVVVEAIPGTKIDGACFWLTKTQPVIALSLRLDRIDNFWFVLRHEIEHVLQRHGQETYILDQDVGASEVVNVEEKVANDAAADFCVSRDEMNGFIARVAPLFSEERVVLFAQRLKVHPGIVVGQLQRRLGRYDLFKKHQVKVRQLVTRVARTDGWGVVEA